MDPISSDKITLAILATAAFSILAWDHCLLIGVDYQVFRRIRQSWRNPRHWMFFFLRYSGLAALFSDMFLSTARHQHCHLASEAFRVFYISTMLAFCGLVSLRVAVIWDYHADVVSGLGILGVSVVGLWVATATQVKVHSEPTFLGSPCSLQPFPTWFSASYVVALAFNLAALSLAAIDTFGKPSSTERDMRQELRLLAFLIVCVAASAAALAIFALDSGQQTSKQIASGFFILMTVSMGSRIFITFAPTELNGPIVVSFGRSFGQSSRNVDSDPSWGSPSTINQSAIRSLPHSSITKPSTRTGTTRPGSLATSESHMLPLIASLNPLPPRRHNPLSPSVAMSNDGDDLRGQDAYLRSTTTDFATDTITPAIVSMPRPRAYRPLPVPPILPASKAETGTESSSGTLLSTIVPNKKRNKLSDAQSGWIE